MLDNIVVDCSPLTGALRIGRVGKARTHLLEWQERENEILCAVRDFLCEKANQNNSADFGYEWTRKDGKIVELRVFIKPEDAELQKSITGLVVEEDEG